MIARSKDAQSYGQCSGGEACDRFWRVRAVTLLMFCSMTIFTSSTCACTRATLLSLSSSARPYCCRHCLKRRRHSLLSGAVGPVPLLLPATCVMDDWGMCVPNQSCTCPGQRPPRWSQRPGARRQTPWPRSRRASLA
eukprot:scaffold6592_cov411-Prasinococcus_capsulatus_cf.AAC.2